MPKALQQEVGPHTYISSSMLGFSLALSCLLYALILLGINMCFDLISRKHYNLEFVHPLYLLSSFCSLFLIDPRALKRGGEINILFWVE